PNPPISAATAPSPPPQTRSPRRGPRLPPQLPQASAVQPSPAGHLLAFRLALVLARLDRNDADIVFVRLALIVELDVGVGRPGVGVGSQPAGETDRHAVVGEDDLSPKRRVLRLRV